MGPFRSISTVKIQRLDAKSPLVLMFALSDVLTRKSSSLIYNLLDCIKTQSDDQYNLNYFKLSPTAHTRRSFFSTKIVSVFHFLIRMQEQETPNV